MRSSILIKGLVLVSISIAPSCLYVGEDDAALGSTDSELLAGEAGQVDEARELTTLVDGEVTYYWIENCYNYPIGRRIIVQDHDAQYAGAYYSIPVGLTVSGSVQGRVLHLKPR